MSKQDKEFDIWMQSQEATAKKGGRFVPPPPKSGYFHQTKRWLYAFTFVLPLAILYEISTFLANMGSNLQFRVAADTWVKRIMDLVGLGGTLPILIICIVLWFLIYSGTKRRDANFKFRSNYFLLMLLESAAWGLILLFFVGYFTSFIFSASPVMQVGTFGIGKGTMLALSFGAGLYEELVFRVVLMGGTIWLLERMGAKRSVAIIIGVLFSSLVFSGVHYVGSVRDVFTIQSFLNRTIAGLAFAGLYAWRGYGVVAWAHALYDVYIILLF